MIADASTWRGTRPSRANESPSACRRAATRSPARVHRRMSSRWIPPYTIAELSPATRRARSASTCAVTRSPRYRGADQRAEDGRAALSRGSHIALERHELRTGGFEHHRVVATVDEE
jgi:hypothetical protein